MLREAPVEDVLDHVVTVLVLPGTSTTTPGGEERVPGAAALCPPAVHPAVAGFAPECSAPAPAGPPDSRRGGTPSPPPGQYLHTWVIPAHYLPTKCIQYELTERRLHHFHNFLYHVVPVLVPNKILDTGLKVLGGKNKFVELKGTRICSKRCYTCTIIF